MQTLTNIYELAFISSVYPCFYALHCSSAINFTANFTVLISASSKCLFFTLLLLLVVIYIYLLSHATPDQWRNKAFWLLVAQNLYKQKRVPKKYYESN